MAIFKESLEHRGNLNIGNWDNVTRKETVRMEETKKRRKRKKQELTKWLYFLHLFSASCIAEILISRSFLLRDIFDRDNRENNVRKLG